MFENGLQYAYLEMLLWTWQLVGIAETHLPGGQHSAKEMVQSLESES